LGSDIVTEIPLDALEVQIMASGHVSLNLSQAIPWEDFPTYATKLLKAIQGQKLSVTDGADMRIWDIVVEGTSLRLVYDDYPNMVALESSDDEGDVLLRRLGSRLGLTD